MKIAIVGGGITGITLAWLLSDLGKVVVYEKTSRLAMKHGSLAEGVTMAPTNESPELSEADAINSETAPDQITQDSENLADLDKGVPIFFPYYQADIARAFEYLGVYTEPCFPSYLSKGKFPFAMDLLPMQGFVFKRMAPFTNRRIEKDVLTVYKSLTKDYRQGNIPTNLSLRQYIRGLKLNDNSINEVIYPTI
ncbi:MAG: FAD-dependent oxidoreductase, partial [Candidatus Portiera sp.]|nr:FAD-dependent oxidoreductase [Portiera sp.]